MRIHHNTLLPLAGAALLSLTIGWSGDRDAGAIGLAVANGGFRVDQTQVWGSSSVFEGSVVETSRTTSQLQVNGGAEVRLAADSRATVYRHRMILERGLTQIEAPPAFAVEACSLTITAEGRDTVARIRLSGERRVTVAVLGGGVAVRNSGGLLVARVEPGISLDFEPQTGAAGAAAPQTGAQTGSAAGGSAGAGSGAPAGASAGGTASGGATGAASGTAGASAGGAAAGGAGGIGIGTIAVIGGVAVAATVGGLAATGSLPGQGQSTPSASR